MTADMKDLRAAMQGPQATDETAITPQEDCFVLEQETGENGFKLKKELTVREHRFIELYLTGVLTVDKAMESAGYEGYNQDYLYRLGRNIIQKYESQAGDHRKIMRAMGYGEIKVINLLIDSAVKAKSEMVRLNARTFLAKCLGMQQDVIDIAQGISIVVNTGPQQGQAPQLVQATITQQSTPNQPARALTILK